MPHAVPWLGLSLTCHATEPKPAQSISQSRLCSMHGTLARALSSLTAGVLERGAPATAGHAASQGRDCRSLPGAGGFGSHYITGNINWNVNFNYYIVTRK